MLTIVRVYKLYLHTNLLTELEPAGSTISLSLCLSCHFSRLHFRSHSFPSFVLSLLSLPALLLLFQLEGLETKKAPQTVRAEPAERRILVHFKSSEAITTSIDFLYNSFTKTTL